ncbi:MAG: glycosyltransferase family 4 protein [Bacteroidales bacterium]|nr:glycosyltransferase family 4 protein [Bacteroidales bacterium]
MKSNGGIARYFTETLNAIKKNDPNTCLEVIIPAGTNKPHSLACRENGRLSTSFAVLRGDVFHTSYYTRWPRLKIPIITTVYDFIDASFPLLSPNGNGFIQRQIDTIRRSSAVISISKSTKELICQFAGIDSSKVYLAYPGVSFPFSGSQPDYQDIRKFVQLITGGAPYILHVGTRGNYKNFRTILRAYSLAAQSKYSERHLVLIGGEHALAPDEIDMVVSSGIIDRVHLLHGLTDKMLHLAYAGADAMVSASLMEGFGIPIVESLSCGTGLILSDISVYREIAEGYAIFLRANSVDDWVTALIGETPPVEAGWKDSIINKFNWDTAAQTHLNVYSALI